MNTLHFWFTATVAHSITGESIVLHKGVTSDDKERARNAVLAQCEQLAAIIWPDDPRFAIFMDSHLPTNSRHVS